MTHTQKTIYLAAGGTGGHLFPALSLAKLLVERAYRVTLLTDARGLEMLGGKPLEGVEVTVMAIPRWKGGLKAKARFAQDLLHSMKIVRRLWKAFPPALVVGFGGYPALPAMVNAMMQGRPLMLHEQNAFMGRVNRFAARCARLIATSFPQTLGIADKDKSKVVVTGFPVREEIQALGQVPYVPSQGDEPFRLLVVGGSQGALLFSTLIPHALALLEAPLRKRLVVYQQARESTLTEVEAFYKNLQVTAHVTPFFQDMPHQLASAHLVITRAGAGALFELLTAARPAVLIPLPTAASDHQTYNGRFFEKLGGGVCLPQKTLTPQGLATVIRQFMEDPQFAKEKAAALAQFPGAAPDQALLACVDKILAECP